MSIGAYTPTSGYSSYSSPTAMDPTASAPTTSMPTDSYSGSSTSYGQNVPVTNPYGTSSKLGMIAGAAGGGFVAWKFLLPLLNIAKSPFSFAAAGVIAGGVLVGGFLGRLFTGGGL